MDDPSTLKDWVVVISAATALVEVVVSPFVSWKIAKRQINASNIFSKRQVWIDELRKDMAEGLAVISWIQDLKRPSSDLSREEHLDVFDKLAEAQFRATEILMRIKLRLNPVEQAHNDLVDAFTKLGDASPDPKIDETEEGGRKLRAEFASARNNVLTITQKILKSEWNRVRKGE